MPNPNQQQGTLNRVKASVQIPSAQGYLDINPQFLGKEGISLALEGNATDYFPSMTGAVPSPVPYQICTLTINLLKSQPFAQNYKAQFEDNTLLGDITVLPDVGAAAPSGVGLAGGIYGLQAYYIKNAVLETVREMSFAGESPLFVVTIKGYYEVNSAMFSQ
ncbi:MAG TPA: hypothetical protein VNZ45_05070 [Bacteroidia bacterium]|jgi:hypothetical protein|nr:hypothetical protein [Bacteroidia bacterium]